MPSELNCHCWLLFDRSFCEKWETLTINHHCRGSTVLILWNPVCCTNTNGIKEVIIGHHVTVMAFISAFHYGMTSSSLSSVILFLLKVRQRLTQTERLIWHNQTGSVSLGKCEQGGEEHMGVVPPRSHGPWLQQFLTCLILVNSWNVTNKQRVYVWQMSHQRQTFISFNVHVLVCWQPQCQGKQSFIFMRTMNTKTMFKVSPVSINPLRDRHADVSNFIAPFKPNNMLQHRRDKKEETNIYCNRCFFRVSVKWLLCQ